VSLEDSGGLRLSNGTTGGSGRARLRFPGTPPHGAIVHVRKEGYRTLRRVLEGRPGAPLRLRLDPADALQSGGEQAADAAWRGPWEFSGRVLDEKGGPLADASVELMFFASAGGVDLCGTSDVVRSSLRTDADGRFRGTARCDDDGLWLLTASSPGHVSATRRATPGRRLDAEFRLPRGDAALTGRTAELGTNEPVAGATLLLMTGRLHSLDGAGAPGTVIRIVRSDASGAFSAGGFPRDESPVGYVVGHPDYPNGYGTMPGGGTILLVGGGRITGEVRSSLTSAPIAGARVYALELGGGSWSRAATTDGAGRFSLRGVPMDAPVRVTASVVAHLDVREERVLTRREPVISLALSMRPAAALRGRVADVSGRPVRHARAVAWSPADAAEGARKPVEGRTDADGRFELTGLDVRLAWNLDVQHENYAPALVETVDVCSPVAVVLRRGGSVQGCVRFADGAAYGGVEVAIVRLASVDAGRRRSSREHRATRTDATGRWRIDALGEGTYAAEIREPARASWEPIAGRSFTAAVSDDVVTELPDAVFERRGSLDVSLSLPEDVLRDATGRVTVYLTPAGRSGTPHAVMVDLKYGGDTSFRLDDLARGDYDVALYVEPHGYTKPQRLQAGSGRRAVFDAPPPGVLEGRIDGSGSAVAGAAIDVYRLDGQGPYRLRGRDPGNLSGNIARSAADGTYRVTGLEPGRYRVGVVHPLFATATVDVEHPGGSLSRNIDLAPPSTIEATVYDRQGRAVARAPVEIASLPSHVFGANALTDDSGRVTFRQLPAGEYVVHARIPDAAPVVHHVRVDRESVLPLVLSPQR